MDKLDKLNNKNHEIDNSKCKKCEKVFVYYDDHDYLDNIYTFPKECICGGLIHCDSWGFDAGYGESETYFMVQCDKCSLSHDLYLPDNKNEFLTEMDIFRREIKEKIGEE